MEFLWMEKITKNTVKEESIFGEEKRIMIMFFSPFEGKKVEYFVWNGINARLETNFAFKW